MSPGELWQDISLEEWRGIVRYTNQEPWGELREDMRMAAVVANILAPFCKGAHDTPDLIYPYILTDADKADEAKRLLDWIKTNGKLARQNDNPPGARCPGDAEGGKAG